MLRGADFSAYQDPAHVDRALAEGIRFAFVKLTEGAGYVSPAARGQLDTLRAHGLRCGVYHYLDPGADAAAQWRHFASSLETLPYWRQLLVCLDYEAAGATDRQAAGFITAGRREGFQVGLYGSAGTHGYARVGQAWRWIAAWTSPSPGPGWRNTTRPPRAAAFWQFAAGSGGDPDWDLFLGDQSAVEAFWGRYSGRRPVYRVSILGRPPVTLGPFLSGPRAALAGLAYTLRHPRRAGWRVDLFR